MPHSKKLLVRVDDAGSSWASNIGCLKACTEGIARSVEVMMPCAWVSHAAQLFKNQPDIDIGIHLTLTSEWDAIKWRPLTPAKSLTGQDGNFLPLLKPREGDGRPSLTQSNYETAEIAQEFQAQIELGLRMFPQASHVSAHMTRHFKDINRSLGDIVSDLCTKFGLKDDPFGHGLPRINGYPKFPRQAETRIAAFQAQLTSLPEGTSIFIDHPAVESAEMAAIGHAGYEDVQQDRLTCLQTLTSPQVKSKIEQLGIELISYKQAA